MRKFFYLFLMLVLTLNIALGEKHPDTLPDFDFIKNLDSNEPEERNLKSPLCAFNFTSIQKLRLGGIMIDHSKAWAIFIDSSDRIQTLMIGDCLSQSHFYVDKVTPSSVFLTKNNHQKNIVMSMT